MRHLITVTTLAMALGLTACGNEENVASTEGVESKVAVADIASFAQPEEASFTVETIAQEQSSVPANVVHFGFNEYKVNETMRPTLDSIVAYLQDHPTARVTVEGHTDPKGSEPINLSMGARRAASIVAYLNENGISEERLESISFGATRLESNDDESRRAVIAIAE